MAEDLVPLSDEEIAELTPFVREHGTVAHLCAVWDQIIGKADTLETLIDALQHDLNAGAGSRVGVEAYQREIARLVRERNAALEHVRSLLALEDHTTDDPDVPEARRAARQFLADLGS